MQALWQDWRFSVRTLAKSPGFALTAVLTVALGIGAVTAIFSVVNAVLLRPFAFARPDRLVSLRETGRERVLLLPVNYQHYLNWKRNSKTLEDATIFRNRAFSVAAGVDHPEMIGGVVVSPNFFRVLGVEPALGRGFAEGEDLEGRSDVVVLSWSAWQRYFRGEANAVGKSLRVDGRPQTVIGVLPRGFSFPFMSEIKTAVSQREVPPVEIFRPLPPNPSPYGNHNYLVIARLRDGATLDQARGELDTIQQALARTTPHMSKAGFVSVEPLQQEVTGGASRALWLLLASVGAVLLIGCVNLANLQMARTVAREREFAVRMALGAERGRLVRLTLMDSVVLAVTGGALGVVLAFAGLRVLLALAPANLPRLNEAAISWPVLLVAAGLSLVTAVLFGVLPALKGMRVDPQAAMQAGTSRVANSREGQRTRSLLVAGEVACTVVLLVVTGLLLRSFSRLLTQQRSFDAEQVTLVQATMASPQYNVEAKRGEFEEHALAALGQVPGVSSVAVTSELPMGGETWVNRVVRPDHAVPESETPSANIRWVSPSYGSTLRIPIIAGRDLNDGDREHMTNALISERAARTIWKDEDPVGRQFSFGQDEVFTVVGVVADARINDLKQTANMVYLPYWQGAWYRAYFLVRSTQTASALAPSLRKAIWSVDPEVAIPLLKPLTEQVNDSVATERFQATLLTSFGAAALLLALVGVYGVLTYSVSLRQQEFGVRVALGSSKAKLMGLVVRQALTPIAGGVVAGLIVAVAATRWVQSLLYETKGMDAGVIAGSVAVLLAAGLLAAMVPARRAAAVDPVVALRAE